MGPEEEALEVEDDGLDADLESLGITIDETRTDDILTDHRESIDLNPDRTPEQPGDAGLQRPPEAASSSGQVRAAPEATSPGSPQEQPQAMHAPAHWTMEQRQQFEAIQPQGQHILMNALQSVEQERNGYLQQIAPYVEVANKWGQHLQDIGLPPMVALDRMLETEFILRRGSNAEKIQAIEGLLAQYNIRDPREESSGEQPAQRIDPAADARIRQLEQHLAAQNQQAEAARQAAYQNQINNFANARNPDGSPMHPYFGSVRQTMGQLAILEQRSGRTPQLGDLYEKACWLDPQIRALMQQTQQRQPQAQEAGGPALDRAMRARRAGQTITGSGAAHQTAVPTDSVDATIDYLVAKMSR